VNEIAPGGLPELRKKGAEKEEDIKLTVKLSICYGQRARRQTAHGRLDPQTRESGHSTERAGNETLALTGFVASKLLPARLSSLAATKTARA
jgi:hypothetical protein